MPGHWEHRAVLGPLTVEDLAPNAEPHRSLESHRVWVEERPIFGRREFTSEAEVREWLHAARRLEAMDRRAERGDSWARREADQLRAEMLAQVPEHPAVPPPPRRHWWEEDNATDWYRDVALRTMRDAVTTTYVGRRMTDTFRYSYDTGVTGRRADMLITDDVVDAMAMMPPMLKETLSEIKKEVMADATSHSTEPVDPYLTNSRGAFTRTYIAITAGSGIRYWQTDGAIPPRAVGRVLARYYGTPEQIQTLRRANEAPKRIHPDPTKLATYDTLNTYDSADWSRAVRSYYSVLWKDGQWWLGKPTGTEAPVTFVPIDPYEEFDE